MSVYYVVDLLFDLTYLDLTGILKPMTPSMLSLPSKFSSFRPVQTDALEWAIGSEYPILAACMPTATGKTLFATALAKSLGGKSGYIVATKSLEKQVMDDMSSIGMVKVHGRSNYHCPVHRNCADGFDAECSRMNSSGCEYTLAVDAAKQSSLFVTNYAYWMLARSNNKRALETDEQPVDFLICDEAHALEQQLTNFLSVSFAARELYGDTPKDGSGRDNDEWLNYTHYILDKFHGSEDLDEADLCERCRKVRRMNFNWVWQFDKQGGVTFSPVHIAPYIRRVFSDVPKVLLMSASLDRFTVKMLIPDDTEFDYRVFPYQLPTGNGPVYHIPTVRLNWQSTDLDYARLITRMDDIIDTRLDRSGIIHTVSYARAQRALQHSRHAKRFIWNRSSSDLDKALEKFRANRGSILVTPSVEEGFDFPGIQCEYQVLLKFPFPNETNRVIKERCSSIKGYRLHHAVQKVNQIKGRPLRLETDRSELFILDNACRQLLSAEGRSYCSPGFRMFTVEKVPPAPPRIN